MSPGDRAKAAEVFSACMKDAEAIEVSRKESRGRALLAAGIIAVGLAASSGNPNSAPTRDAPLNGPRIEMAAGPDEFTSAETISDITAELQRQVDADARFKGHVLVVDTGVIDEDEMVSRASAHMATAGAELIQDGKIQMPEVTKMLGEIEYAEAHSNGLAPDEPGYVCIAAAHKVGASVDALEQIQTRTEGRVKFAGNLRAVNASRMIVAHEVGHCLTGLNTRFPDDALASRRWSENTGDAFGSLWHLATGGNPADVARLADLRDIRLGYAPANAEINPLAYSISHDTSATLRAIVADAPALMRGGLASKSVSELAGIATKYVEANFPGPEELEDQAKGFDVVKSLVSNGTADRALSDYAPYEIVALQRFDAAFRTITGQAQSPVTPLLHASPASPLVAQASNQVVATAPVASVSAVRVPQPLAGASVGDVGGWAPTSQASEDVLLHDMMAMVSGHDAVGRGLYLFARHMAADSADSIQVADMAMRCKLVRDSLPGFTLMGMRSPARKNAEQALAATVSSAMARYVETAHPLRVPAFSPETHGVKMKRDIVSVHLLNEGWLGRLDNPVDAAAVIRGNGERNFQNGQRTPEPYGMAGLEMVQRTR